MNGYLLDTNVLSELRKESRAALAVRAWFRAVSEQELYLSVLVLGEVQKGIELARPRDPVKADVLEAWVRSLEEHYAERMLPVTSSIAHRWGRLSAVRPISVVDGLIAATALDHSLTVVTRNAGDFAHTGAALLNPFF